MHLPNIIHYYWVIFMDFFKTYIYYMDNVLRVIVICCILFLLYELHLSVTYLYPKYIQYIKNQINIFISNRLMDIKQAIKGETTMEYELKKEDIVIKFHNKSIILTENKEIYVNDNFSYDEILEIMNRMVDLGEFVNEGQVEVLKEG